MKPEAMRKVKKKREREKKEEWVVGVIPNLLFQHAPPYKKEDVVMILRQNRSELKVILMHRTETVGLLHTKGHVSFMQGTSFFFQFSPLIFKISLI